MRRYLNLKATIQAIDNAGGFRGLELFTVGFMSAVIAVAFILLGVTLALIGWWISLLLFVVGFTFLYIWVTIGLILDDREALFRRGLDPWMEAGNVARKDHGRGLDSED
jgi:hypothetical protein